MGVCPGCSLSMLYEDLLSTENAFNVEQMARFPTRLSNSLNIFFTSTPTLIKSVKLVAIISNHDIVQFTSDFMPPLNKQQPRTVHVHVFRKVN